MGSSSSARRAPGVWEQGEQLSRRKAFDDSIAVSVAQVTAEGRRPDARKHPALRASTISAPPVTEASAVCPHPEEAPITCPLARRWLFKCRIMFLRLFSMASSLLFSLLFCWFLAVRYVPGEFLRGTSPVHANSRQQVGIVSRVYLSVFGGKSTKETRFLHRRLTGVRVIAERDRRRPRRCPSMSMDFFRSATSSS